MASLFAKLGQHPQRSMALFLKGLGLFLIGAAFVALGYYQQYWWQIIGLVFLAVGAAIAAIGYLGIFANRLTSMVRKPRQPRR